MCKGKGRSGQAGTVGEDERVERGEWRGSAAGTQQ
jgi:hypothetical protein